VSEPESLPTVADVVADTRVADDDRLDRILRQIGAVDRAVYGAIADTPTPDLDEALRRLSNAASYSKLWFGIAGGLAVLGGPTGRRASAIGVGAVGTASLVVNQGLKRVTERTRPDRDGENVPEARYVEMPASTSFPSGHSASAFAFATAVGSELPVTGSVLRLLAAAVAYSRVHTGVHYPGDALVGSLVGGMVGQGVAMAARRFRS